jgi:chromosome segregation ATPase
VSAREQQSAELESQATGLRHELGELRASLASANEALESASVQVADTSEKRDVRVAELEQLEQQVAELQAELEVGRA